MSVEKRAHILLVDDDPVVSDMIASALNPSYQVNIVHSGQKAVEVAAGQMPELILLDIMLNDTHGHDVCRQIKSNPMIKDIPIIFMSCLSESFDKVQAFNVGGVDYVTKPIEIAELRMRIHTHITMSRLQKNLEHTVRQRTVDLEKSNAALRASLDHRETEMHAIEETILTRIKKFIHPYLNKLDKCKLGRDGALYVDIIRSNLNELIPTSANTLSANYLKLTPAEIKVADLIRQGIQTRQIADQLNLSGKSVFYYRNNIRRKLGLLNTKIHLTTYLESLNKRS